MSEVIGTILLPLASIGPGKCAKCGLGVPVEPSAKIETMMSSNLLLLYSFILGTSLADASVFGQKHRRTLQGLWAFTSRKYLHPTQHSEAGHYVWATLHSALFYWDNKFIKH